LELNIYGVNLPEHFVLCYKENDEILFYINTFNKGFVFAKKDIDKFLKQLNIEIKEAYYQPCDNLTIIKQLIKNLIVSYQHLGYPEKIEELKLMLECLK
jgi:regulator of sirC expression with transglutaminase-like and TPR domain